jgi:Nucleotidyl transferase AbiEii toxin, Type IV TA system
MPTFEPKLSILSEQQNRLWLELRSLPKSFILCGGTGIALQLGHRPSIDFDFVGCDEFDPDQLYAEITFLSGSKPVQKAASTLKCVVERGGPVQISFFGAPKLRWIGAPVVASDIGLNVASLLNLAAMKAAVVQKRAEPKDYRDIDALIGIGQVDLPMALSAAQYMYGSQFNPELTLKALSYFGEESLKDLPEEVRRRLLSAVAAVDLRRLPPAAELA